MSRIFNLRQSRKEELIEEILKQDKQIEVLQEQLENAIVLPKGFDLNQVVYMIPNSTNGLKGIKSYRILSFNFSAIGCRADLSLCVKEKGVAPFYSAGFERFGHSIFATYEDAEKRLAELKGERE